MSPALPKGVLDLRVLDLRVTGTRVARIMDAHPGSLVDMYL